MSGRLLYKLGSRSRGRRALPVQLHPDPVITLTQTHLVTSHLASYTYPVRPGDPPGSVRDRSERMIGERSPAWGDGHHRSEIRNPKSEILYFGRLSVPQIPFEGKGIRFPVKR